MIFGLKHFFAFDRIGALIHRNENCLFLELKGKNDVNIFPFSEYFLQSFHWTMTGRFLDFGGGGTRPLPTCDRQPTRNGSIRQPEAEKSNWKIIISRNILAAPFLCLTLIKGNVTGAQGFSSQFLIQSRTSTSDFERELYRAPQ